MCVSTSFKLSRRETKRIAKLCPEFLLPSWCILKYIFMKKHRLPKELEKVVKFRSQQTHPEYFSIQFWLGEHFLHNTSRKIQKRNYNIIGSFCCYILYCLKLGSNVDKKHGVRASTKSYKIFLLFVNFAQGDVVCTNPYRRFITVLRIWHALSLFSTA